MNSQNQFHMSCGIKNAMVLGFDLAKCFPNTGRNSEKIDKFKEKEGIKKKNRHPPSLAYVVERAVPSRKNNHFLLFP